MIEDYHRALSKYPAGTVRTAVAGHIESGEFFPRLSELEARCKRFAPPSKRYLPPPRRREPTAEEKARVAEHWEQVRAEIAAVTNEPRSLASMTKAEAAARVRELSGMSEEEFEKLPNRDDGLTRLGDVA